jgi:hypothetical protein
MVNCKSSNCKFCLCFSKRSTHLKFCVDLFEICVDLLDEKVNAEFQKTNAEFQKVNAKFQMR